LGQGPDVTSLVSKPEEVIARDSLQRGTTIANFTAGPTGKIALEPTILEDQKKRYLDHLHELRRINEGDDNTDAPGYALNLIRIPVSLVAGQCTETGCGAECDITANPHLTPDLLPQTFRNLVVNDIVGMLTLPLTRVIENVPSDELKDSLRKYET